MRQTGHKSTWWQAITVPRGYLQNQGLANALVTFKVDLGAVVSIPKQNRSGNTEEIIKNFGRLYAALVALRYSTIYPYVD